MIQELLAYFNPFDYLVIWLFAAFAIALFVSLNTFPAIFMISVKKQLMDEPGSRSAHSKRTPTLGGIAIFMSLVVVITTMGGFLDTKVLLLLLGGMTILFFLGLKDDLLVLSPRKKFLGQLMAALVLIIFTDTRIIGFSGIFGITTMPYWVSVIFTLFVYILIINAYNLIDGIDGLAGSLALFACVAFTYVFLITEEVSLATISVATIGSLIPFLKLNFAKKRKIFMGDTGSMIIGFLLSFFVVRFISEAQTYQTSVFYNSAPVLALSIVFFPLLDTLRIFFIRVVIHKKSPFAADQNHLHHNLLKLGYSHKQITAWVVIINMILFVLALLFKDFEIHLQFVLLLSIGTILYSAVFIYHWMLTQKSKSKIAEHTR
ncbi:MraY family glycosyltransferase [Gelidibacter salicanalis]|uniref:Undecaprenyl/decaprenyl-phosphate alpha-N-acetylglucosaminyl 1-phosphate transferase n=1 Tax=Gelidibacter salicanalis TaxID=291193 RepID=A0A934NB19_9FLAO|nr:MraY family glycosyltransferase [Gelidibacter salicanalis]MBJ7879150.1 undecaprenyl/decaprenyl-phosphate alpha-N-acetylglucosaminyl 1-phosphate transferase [Gelidibacter salicanalis]